MKIFAMAAALRMDSSNQKLVHQVVQILRSKEIESDLAQFKEFEMPLYDGDFEEAHGIPLGTQKLVERLRSADAIILSTPEYNGGIPGTLKNALDWVSRTDPMPFEGKPLLLIGASPGALGAVRGLWHTRVPFEAVGALVYPEMFGLPRSYQAFDPSGNFVDPKSKTHLENLITEFLRFAGQVIRK